MKKSTIIVGAGGDVSFEIPAGADFASSIIFNDKDDNVDLKNAIDNFYRNKVKELKENSFYPNYHIPRYFSHKTLLSNSLGKMIISNKTEKYFSVEEEILEYKDFLDSNKREKFEKEFKVIKSRSDEKINRKQKLLIYNDNNSLELTSHGWFIVHSFPNYMGVLDERFYTLINPKHYGVQKFWGVINSYTRAYLNIITSLLDMNKKNNYNEDTYRTILENPIDTYNKVLHNINHKLTSNLDNKSYYKILSKKNLNYITTNYTPILQESLNFYNRNIEGNELNISYIHGKLSWFESAKNLTVYDLVKETNEFEEQFSNDVLFPYIFIQSGIKPIVEFKQISELSKSLSYLNNSNTLYILGYNINDDDNHLNSLIRNFVQNKDNNLIYFYYHAGLEKNIEESSGLVKNEVKNKLRLDSEDDYSNIKVHYIGKDSLEYVDKIII